ncbi:SPRY domain-containing protein [Ditylenchus destructor]|nr:SPRY domain-containing protein [Ditylenchus destructor]
MESKHNPHGAPQPPPAVVQSEMEPPTASSSVAPTTSVVKMCAYEFLSAAQRERLPTCWTNGVGKAKSYIITLDSPTSPRYTGFGFFGSHYGASVRTEIRIPAKLLAYYYEVTIVNPGKAKFIAIGFGRNRKDMEGLPGCQESDRGFHFNDGRFYDGDYTKGEQYHNGSPVEDGAVYGCGVDFRTNLMFFTKNGVIIAFEPPIVGSSRKMSYGLGHLYPIVGLCGPNTQLDTNFGEKAFLFDFKSYYKRGYLKMLYPKNPVKKRVSMPAENPGPSKLPRRNVSVTLPNIDESVDADEPEHTPQHLHDIKPRMSKNRRSSSKKMNGILIDEWVYPSDEENPQEIQTGRDIPLAENEDPQTNATSADESEHVLRDQNDVKPQVRITLENPQEIETGQDITLAENEHSQSNATGNVAENVDVDSILPYCEPDEAELDHAEVIGEIVNNAGSRVNNQAQVKNEVPTVKPEILEAAESNGQCEGFDINEVLDQIRRGDAQEAEAKIIASEFGPFYESDPGLVLFLKIQGLIELWKGNAETEEDERNIRLLGKTIASLANGLSNERIQKKVEDSLLLSYSARNQEMEKHKYLLLPDERLKVAIMIEKAFNAYKVGKEYHDLMRSI